MYTVSHPLTYPSTYHDCGLDIFFLKNRSFLYKILWYLRTVLYVLPDDIVRTKSVPVKLVVQIWLLFVVIVGERGAEGSYFVPKDPTKLTEICTTDVQFLVKSLWVR